MVKTQLTYAEILLGGRFIGLPGQPSVPGALLLRAIVWVQNGLNGPHDISKQ